MPELPEVETVRKGLQQLVSGKTIRAITIRWDNIIATSLPLTDWCALITNQTIRAVSRRGKYLIFELDEGYLISHLRMEGKFHHYEAHQIPQQPSKHVHAIFTMTDGSQLHYEDVRKIRTYLP